MRFVLEIDCDGPAFRDDMRGEVGTLLRLVCLTLDCTDNLRGQRNEPACTWRFIAAPAPDPDGVSSPDLGMVIAED
jgi:hypothetical protein